MSKQDWYYSIVVTAILVVCLIMLFAVIGYIARN